MSTPGAGPAAEHDRHSIGEVLSLLQDEFPDITISKIRFLETQGLIEPERTPSGYRKFSAEDVQRLRWILRQQREKFLPLKVIKGRLEASGPDGTPSAVALAPDPDEGEDLLDSGVSSVSMTAEEHAAASGLTDAEVDELARFGLLAGRNVGGSVLFDEEALVVARLAADFGRHGVEPRHLRMYVNAAEREAGFFEQIVMPIVKQRDPAARRRAGDTLSELTRLGQGLRAALLRRTLRTYLGRS